MSGIDKEVFTIVDSQKEGQKSRWTKVGVGFYNKDGSITVKLDALPVNGTLQIRQAESQEEREARKKAAPF